MCAVVAVTGVAAPVVMDAGFHFSVGAPPSFDVGLFIFSCLFSLRALRCGVRWVLSVSLLPSGPTRGWESPFRGRGVRGTSSWSSGLLSIYVALGTLCFPFLARIARL